MKINTLVLSTIFTSTIYAASVSTQETDFWLYTKQKDTISYYKLYLQTYPNGNFTSQANQSIQELDSSSKTSSEIDFFEDSSLSEDDSFYKENESEEKTTDNDRTSSIGFGLGLFGLEFWLHKDYLDYGFAVQLTPFTYDNTATNTNLFINIHTNKDDSGFYFPITIGRVSYYEKSTAQYDNYGNYKPTAGYTSNGNYTGEGEYDSNGDYVNSSLYTYNSDGEYVGPDGYAQTSSLSVGTGVGYRWGSDTWYLDTSLRVAYPTAALYPSLLIGLKFN